MASAGVFTTKGEIVVWSTFVSILVDCVINWLQLSRGKLEVFKSLVCVRSAVCTFALAMLEPVEVTVTAPATDSESHVLNVFSHDLQIVIRALAYHDKLSVSSLSQGDRIASELAFCLLEFELHMKLFGGVNTDGAPGNVISGNVIRDWVESALFASAVTVVIDAV